VRYAEATMSLLTLLVIIVCVGIVMWAIQKASFISPPIKQIALIVCVVVVGLLVLNTFGVIDALRGVKVPQVGRGR
jgi:hypothetical protein